MKYPAATATLFVPCLLLLFLFSATSADAELTSNLQGCVPNGEFDPTIDYFPEKYIPRESFYKGPPPDFFPGKFVPDNTTDFLNITYHNWYKIVTNKFHNKSYLLYQCGTTPPEHELVEGRHHLVLPVPHTAGIAVTETPQIPHMELLGKRRDMIAYIGNPDYVASPCMKYMMETEGTIQVYYDPTDPWNATKMAAFKQDFVQQHPDAIILEGPISGDIDGPRAIAMAASQERTNVATFDWIGLFGALFNLEDVANTIAAGTLERYECSSSNAAIVSADLPAHERPVVLWAQYFEGYGWSVAECPTWQSTYYCEYAKHCGANIISRPTNVGYTPDGSLSGLYWYVTDTDLLELGKDADVWVYASQTWDTVYEQKKDLLDQFKAVQNQQVYDTQGQGANAWFEQRLAEYEVVALDFCEIVGNSNPVGPLHVRRWLRNIFTEPIGALDACQIPDEIDQPYSPKSAECTPLSTTSNDSASAAAAVAAATTTLFGAFLFAVLFGM